MPHIADAAPAKPPDRAGTALAADALLEPCFACLKDRLGEIRIVDCHTHLGCADPDGSCFDADELVGALEVVDGRAVVFPLAEPDSYRAANDRTLALAQAAGDRLVPFCRVDPRDGGLKEVQRAIARGAAGIKLHPRAERFGLNDPAVSRIAAFADERRLPIIVHAGRGIPSLGRDALELARAFPHAPIILAHLAISDLAWIWRPAAGQRNLFFGTAWWNTADCCEPVVYPDVERDQAARMATIAKALGDPVRLQLCRRAIDRGPRRGRPTTGSTAPPPNGDTAPEDREDDSWRSRRGLGPWAVDDAGVPELVSISTSHAMRCFAISEQWDDPHTAVTGLGAFGRHRMDRHLPTPTTLTRALQRSGSVAAIDLSTATKGERSQPAGASVPPTRLSKALRIARCEPLLQARAEKAAVRLRSPASRSDLPNRPNASVGLPRPARSLP